MVATSQRTTTCNGEIIDGQVIMNDTTLQYLTSYLEYDSIHFTHLEVLLPQTTNDISVNVDYGDTFQQVLIENDTSFTISYITENHCDSLVVYHVSALNAPDDKNALFQTIKLFPNPVSGWLNVSHQLDASTQDWHLINNFGQTIWKTQLAPYEKIDSISMEDYPVGIYWLKVQTDYDSRVWKVVVH